MARSGEGPIGLTRGEVHVWWALPEYECRPELVELHEALLSPEEMARQRACLVEWRRREHLLTRALARTSLSRYAVADPKDLRFRLGAYGRPELVEPDWLQFNLSNCPGMVICAVSRRRIGIDLEPHGRGPEILQIARGSFARAELEELAKVPSRDRPDRALSLWTSKEAYIKARGMGLAIPLDSFTVGFGASAMPSIRQPSPEKAAESGWDLHLFDRGAHRVALAVEREIGPPVRVLVAQARPLVESVRMPGTGASGGNPSAVATGAGGHSRWGASNDGGPGDRPASSTTPVLVR